ncbi:MAG: hypothetical protein JW728_02395 [Candidatus Aureabacteria bacterium]|nr:hypothetical protein [Candidatus Auribacterota bacterium]
MKKPGEHKVNTKSILAVVMLISLSALFFVAKPVYHKKDLKAPATWVCSSCNFFEVEEIGPSPAKCPRCEDNTLFVTAFFVCGDCGTKFEGYRNILKYSQNRLTSWEIVTMDGRIINPRDSKQKTDYRTTIRCPKCDSKNIQSTEFTDMSPPAL